FDELAIYRALPWDREGIAADEEIDPDMLEPLMPQVAQVPLEDAAPSTPDEAAQAGEADPEAEEPRNRRKAP
ncbi:MAG: hypothetical protein D6717_05260, partial [Gammaproteobacteria bacterium]